MKVTWKLIFPALFAAFFLFGCAGDDGAAGTAGATGATGGTGGTGGSGVSGPWPTPGPIGPENDPTGAAAPAAYTAANGILGGAAYSKWWLTDAAGSVVKATETADLTADYGITQTANKDFYRCKACHGWDGFGNRGSYADRTGASTLSTGRPDVASGTVFWMAKVMTYTELYDAIAGAGGRAINTQSNAHPDFSTLLTAAQIWNLVKFMKEEWIQPGVTYDLVIRGDPLHLDAAGTGTVSPTLTYLNVGLGGTAATGDTAYTAKCTGCHGADGKTIDLGGRSLGKFLRDKPNEMWFKAKFGEVGSSMGSGIVTSTTEMLDLYSALTDTVTYPD